MQGNSHVPSVEWWGLVFGSLANIPRPASLGKKDRGPIKGSWGLDMTSQSFLISGFRNISLYRECFTINITSIRISGISSALNTQKTILSHAYNSCCNSEINLSFSWNAVQGLLPPLRLTDAHQLRHALGPARVRVTRKGGEHEMIQRRNCLLREVSRLCYPKFVRLHPSHEFGGLEVSGLPSIT